MKLPGSAMKSETSWLARVTQRICNAQYFSVSLIIHLILGIALGSVVLFKTVHKADGFTVSEGLGFIASTEESVAPENPADAEFETDEVALEMSGPVNASTIQALTDTASFQLVRAPAEQTFGGYHQSVSIGSGLAGVPGTGGSRGKLASGSLFGARSSTAPGLVGTFYDLKQTNKRKPTEVGQKEYEEEVSEFIRSWSPTKLNRFFRAPMPLVTSQIFTPIINADLAPKAFGVEKDVEPSRWLAWYRARVSPPKSGTFHFVGGGDDVLFVRFNGKLVLNGSWRLESDKNTNEGSYDYSFSKIPNGFKKGTGFRAEKGQFYDLDILIGELPGKFFFADLLIEEVGAAYDKDAKGNPILPVFRVAETSVAEDGVYPPHAKDGPVWSVEPPRN